MLSIFLRGRSLREKGDPHAFRHWSHQPQTLDQQIIEMYPENVHMLKKNPNSWWKAASTWDFIKPVAHPWNTYFSASEVKRRCPHEAQDDSCNDQVHVPGIVPLSSLICPPRHKWLQDKSICHHWEPSTLCAHSTPSIRLLLLPFFHMIHWGPFLMGHGRLKTKQS